MTSVGIRGILALSVTMLAVSLGVFLLLVPESPVHDKGGLSSRLHAESAPLAGKPPSFGSGDNGRRIVGRQLLGEHDCVLQFVDGEGAQLSGLAIVLEWSDGRVQSIVLDAEGKVVLGSHGSEVLTARSDFYQEARIVLSATISPCKVKVVLERMPHSIRVEGRSGAFVGATIQVALQPSDPLRVWTGSDRVQDVRVGQTGYHADFVVSEGGPFRALVIAPGMAIWSEREFDNRSEGIVTVHLDLPSEPSFSALVRVDVERSLEGRVLSARLFGSDPGGALGDTELHVKAELDSSGRASFYLPSNVSLSHFSLRSVGMETELIASDGRQVFFPELDPMVELLPMERHIGVMVCAPPNLESPVPFSLLGSGAHYVGDPGIGAGIALVPLSLAIEGDLMVKTDLYGSFPLNFDFDAFHHDGVFRLVVPSGRLREHGALIVRSNVDYSGDFRAPDLLAAPSGGGTQQGSMPTYRATLDGSYSIVGMIPGRYQLSWAWPGGGERLFHEGVDISSGASTKVDVEVPRIETVEGLCLIQGSLPEGQRPGAVLVEGVRSSKVEGGRFTLRTLLPWPEGARFDARWFPHPQGWSLGGASAEWRDGQPVVTFADFNSDIITISAEGFDGKLLLEYTTDADIERAGLRVIGGRYHRFDADGLLSLLASSPEGIYGWLWIDSGGERSFGGWLGNVRPLESRNVVVSQDEYLLTISVPSIHLDSMVEVRAVSRPLSSWETPVPVQLGEFKNGVSRNILLPSEVASLQAFVGDRLVGEAVIEPSSRSLVLQ